jgi:GntR family transcriptional regulator
LGVNKNTVLRARHILRDEGLLDVQRGRGMTVAGTIEHGVVVKRERELVEFCRIQGYRRDEVVQIIESLPLVGPYGPDSDHVLLSAPSS